jgi:hypothetical protein
LKAKDGQMPNLPWTAEIRRKAKDDQMPNLPWTAGILPGSPIFCALPGKKILAVRRQPLGVTKYHSLKNRKARRPYRGERLAVPPLFITFLLNAKLRFCLLLRIFQQKTPGRTSP